MVRCSTCRELKLPSEFYRNRSRGNGLDARCKRCQTVYNREREERLRKAVLVAYGGACEDCGATVDLQAHHLQFNGNEHRQHGASTRYYRDILENLADYALLCRSCHKYRHLDRKKVRV